MKTKMKNSKLLPTTVVGSYPKPMWLNHLIKEHEAGNVSDKVMESAYTDAIKAVVKDQELAGIDILWDGEMRREEMTSYFANHIGGFKIYGEVRVWGNNYYKKPAIVSEFTYRDKLTIDEFENLKSITNRRIKVPITGPYTIVDWSYNEYYKTKEDAVYALAEVINKELRGLVKAGCNFIQLDEPAISTHPEELEIAKNATEIVTKGVNAYIGMHICFGEYEKIYPNVLDFPVDQFDFEFANRKFSALEVFKEHDFTKDIGFGCIDVHTPRVESVDEVAANIERALTIWEPNQIYVDPDCGLKLLPSKIAFEKLKVMCEAAQKVRDKL